MECTRTLPTLLLTLAGVAAVLACDRAGIQPPTGRELFVRHCASCHGTEGRGDGSVADFLRNAPPDLTQIQKQGRFDETNLMMIIDGRRVVPVHGTREMPVWGAVFEAELEQDGAYTHRTALLQTGVLVEYLRTIQEP